ncbi:hypothetical protein N665_0196s0049 [Sinapis alba]|nr:hypothetical protein N665_0196s0049 [Sinapis alba]
MSKQRESLMMAISMEIFTDKRKEALAVTLRCLIVRLVFPPYSICTCGASPDKEMNFGGTYQTDEAPTKLIRALVVLPIFHTSSISRREAQMVHVQTFLLIPNLLVIYIGVVFVCHRPLLPFLKLVSCICFLRTVPLFLKEPWRS